MKKLIVLVVFILFMAPFVFAATNSPKVVRPIPEMLLWGYSVTICHFTSAFAGSTTTGDRTAAKTTAKIFLKCTVLLPSG